jgi:SAM-dependent methyltransferase
MLKSLHHVPIPLMDRALAEVARVLRPGGHLYVSEPVYEGPFNDIVRLFNDEAVVRAAAQRAVDAALAPTCRPRTLAGRARSALHDHVGFSDFADFEPA